MASHVEMQEQKEGLLAGVSRHVHTSDSIRSLDISRARRSSSVSSVLSSIRLYSEKDFDEHPGRFTQLLSYLDTSMLVFYTYILPLIIPSFLHGPLLRLKAPEPKALHPTAYLDGLRGVAAFIVVIFHLTMDWYPSLNNGFDLDDEKRWWLQMPLIRTFYGGGGMVSVFFVISGYVLSAKGLRLTRKNEFESLLSSLSSSVFRRGMRLYFPVVASSLISVILLKNGLYTHDPKPQNFLGTQLDSWHGQIKDWFQAFVMETNMHVPLNAFAYGGHLWTLPIEYNCSIAIFVTVLGLAKVRSHLRTAIILVCTIYNALVNMENWDLFLFMAGMSLAEVHGLFSSSPLTSTVSLDSNDKPTTNMLLSACVPLRRVFSNSYVKHALLAPVFALGFHALGAPMLLTMNTRAYGFRTLVLFTPRAHVEGANRFWMSTGAVMVTSCISFSPILQYPFTTRFAQWLGRISFSMYLIHGHVLYTVGMKMLLAKVVEGMGNPYVWEGKDQGVTWEGVAPGYNVAYWKAAVLMVSLVFWVADIFTRLVDEPSVRLAAAIQRWAWGKNN